MKSPATVDCQRPFPEERPFALTVSSLALVRGRETAEFVSSVEGRAKSRIVRVDCKELVDRGGKRSSRDGGGDLTMDSDQVSLELCSCEGLLRGKDGTWKSIP